MKYFLKLHFISLPYNSILRTCEKAMYRTEFVKSSVICVKGIWLKGWNLGQEIKNNSAIKLDFDLTVGK